MCVDHLNDFDRKILENTGSYLFTHNIKNIQVNVGLLCNNQCVHCHVQAAPKKMEIIEWRTMHLILNLARKTKPKLIDISAREGESKSGWS